MSESEVKPIKKFFNKIHSHVKNTAMKAKTKIASVFHKDDNTNDKEHNSAIEKQISIFYGNARNKTISDIIEISAHKEDRAEAVSDDSDLSNYNSVRIKETTAVSMPLFSRIIGNITSFFKSKTKDGVINNAKQGNTSDCWLVAAVNAISYTKSGKNTIKEAIEYKEEGVLVHLKGARDYFIPNKILNTAKGSLQYARNDDDMIIIELAIESALDDITNGKIMLHESALHEKYYFKKATKAGVSTLDSGSADALFYLLTGKVSEFKIKDADGENLSAAFNLFKENKNKDLAMAVGLYKASKTVKDIHGKKVKIDQLHTYSVKKVSDGTITLTDPLEPKRDIELDIETAVAAFDDFHVMDLSAQNMALNVIVPNEISVKKLNNGGKLEQMVDKNGKILREIEYNKRGKRVSMHTFGENTESLFEYDRYGQVTKYTVTYKTDTGEYRTTEHIFSEFGEELATNVKISDKPD